jgi:hypothetical protein
MAVKSTANNITSGLPANTIGSGGIDQLTGDVTAGPGSGSQATVLDPTYKTRILTLIFDGQGSAIGAGLLVNLPKSAIKGTITGWAIASLDGTTGDIEFDIKKDVTFPATTSIVAAAPPSITGADEGDSSTLTGWTVTIDVGDFIQVSVTSAATVTRVQLQLTITATV